MALMRILGVADHPPGRQVPPPERKMGLPSVRSTLLHLDLSTIRLPWLPPKATSSSTRSLPDRFDEAFGCSVASRTLAPRGTAA